jgi:transglutaminase-like putative cysteine protease
MSESISPELGEGDGDFERYLRATDFIDSDHPAVIAFARQAVGEERDEVAKAVKLYYAVRDEFRYDPYAVELVPEHFKASSCLAAKHGFCITKAVLLAAAGRAIGLPTRLGFADVRNHLATKRLLEELGTDIFYYHGYTEFFLEGRWVKATPAFNLGLCEKFHVLPLKFDGHEDSIFHPFDAAGRKHMEYVNDRGQYDDLPFNDVKATFLATSPEFYSKWADGGLDGDFEAEAAAEN